MVAEGEAFPADACFTSISGENICPGNEKGVVIVYFYPRAMTPGCTREALRFNELYDEFEKCGAKVYGVSTDSPERNKKFAEKYGLRFPLLSDPTGEVIARLGVLKKGTKRPSAQRVTFILKDGVIVRVLKNIRPAEKHADKSLEVVKELVSC
ncbi:MAG: peroxiredoxin [Desulfurococcales archaeon]|nr:peroxiredoxin [Desulfurococcales archaeon]